MRTLPLRAALIRGVLLVAANWPIVLIDFGIESLYKLALSLPVFGGALMAGALAHGDLRNVVADGVGPTANLVLGALAESPVALGAFLGALAIAAIGGEVLMFVVKAGTLAVVVAADREAGEVQDEPFGTETLQDASRFRLDLVIESSRHFATRAVMLALGLGAIYLFVGLGYVAVVMQRAWTPSAGWIAAWPVLVLLATSVSVVSIEAASLAYDLLRVIVITDDCSVRAAMTRLRRFVIEDARQVLGIFGVMAAVVLLATAASLLATAGLAPVAYIPIVGLTIVPLQVAVWLFRGLLFQALSLASLSAYQTQYRRFSSARTPVS
jgi:hypothetical protein